MYYKRLLLLVVFYSHVALAQQMASNPKSKESFDFVKSNVIKKELAFFTISASFKEEEVDSIYRTPVQEIAVYDNTSTSVTFIQKGVSVKIRSTTFDTTGHSFTYSVVDPLAVSCIDGKPFWGTDGAIPKNKLNTISVQCGNKSFMLPDSALTNLFEPNFCFHLRKEQKIKCHSRVYQSADKKRIYIYMLNGDGAGGYEVTWIIEEGKYVGRVIDYGF